MTNYTKYTHLNRRDFLGVPGAGDGFVLVIFETDVLQLMIWHVLNVDPAHIELALPFWITPNACGKYGIGMKTRPTPLSREELHYD